MAKNEDTYPARLEIEYIEKHDRMTTLLRIFWSIPALILVGLLTSSGSERFINEAGDKVTTSAGGILGGLFAATMLMIVFRQRYPRWWFDFALELNRFSTRVGAYLFMLTDLYPSTTDKQSVTLDVDYPNVKRDLNRWLPLVKWLLAIPHYIVLVVLIIGVFIASIVAWFSIVFTGSYPKDIFEYVVGVGRWALRVNAYAFLLTTDTYPPFSLK